jgi:hypothetical protein
VLWTARYLDVAVEQLRGAAPAEARERAGGGLRPLRDPATDNADKDEEG